MKESAPKMADIIDTLVKNANCMDKCLWQILKLELNRIYIMAYYNPY